MEMVVPGMHKDDFRIKLENNQLTVSNVLKENATINGKYTLREFQPLRFNRSFTLNEKLVDAAQIGAKYENGILMITLPKKEEIKQPSRLIEIA